ncbi:MAG TPA: hypothetical protein PLV68_16390 [Ilumatobacteraceae bacterium]|nr:hypothetical protein [Ilumatobacteraceae bacterium]
MNTPVYCTRVDPATATVVLTVSGPLTSCEHVDLLCEAVNEVPSGRNLIVELDAMTTLSASSLTCLRDLAVKATEKGLRLMLVSESIDVRANLVLADLDSLAPVLHSLAQANQIVAAAA